MRIATMVKGYLTVPAPEDIVYAPADLALQITDGLIELGHSVDFYAPEGSNVGKAHLVSRTLKPLAHDFETFQALLYDPEMASDNVLATWDNYLASEMFARAATGEYDVLFFHHPEVALPFVSIYPDVPVIYTMHDPISELQSNMLQMHTTPNQHFISISDKQRATAPDLPYLATIYNGVNTDYFVPAKRPTRDYLLFAGRITPKKGAKEAVEVARQSGMKLKIAGSIFPNNQDYFDTHVKPYIDGERIEFLGFVSHYETAELFQNAAGFLMPIQWEEPFGLTMAEAMASGTPVIAMGRGSVPEIIDDGKTGFVAQSVKEMVAAVKKLDTIDPALCRSTALERFSVETMVRHYEKAFTKAIKIAKK